MRVIVALESRFDRTPDGAVWAGGWLEYSFWRRYLDVFEEVRVLARVRDVAAVAPGAKRADGPSVVFWAVPYYVGPWQYALRRRRIGRVLRDGIGADDAVILRAPGTISTLAARYLLRRGRPFGVEVVGDPLDVFATGGVRSIVSPILRRTVPRELRRQCASACAVAYVSTASLPARYPAGPAAFVTTYSTIDLADDAFAASARRERDRAGPFHVLLVGSLEQLYKGPDVLIRAVAECVRKGTDVVATIVGDGRERPGLERLATALGLSDCVRLAGHLPAGRAVRDEMDRADLFVLPSRTEGLPRALLEAMARAAPCIASRVGGIPELLPQEDLVPPGDETALACKIAELTADPARLVLMSVRNLATARSYHASVLRPRRRAFYEYVRNAKQRMDGRT